MNLCALLIAVAIFLAKTEAQAIIGHNQVRPFPQPEPVTIAQKAAVKFKPQLKISDGCHPHAAVQKDGSIGGGLEWSGALDGQCTGSKLGSQIYARIATLGNMCAIVYAWYFPKGGALMSSFFLGILGHRHNWEYLVLWINTYDVKNIDSYSIVSVAMSADYGYDQQPPNEKFMNDTSTKVKYYYKDIAGITALKLTEDSGEFQDLITWDQLSDLARYSLNSANWGIDTFDAVGVTMPLKDGEFEKILAQTKPF